MTIKIDLDKVYDRLDWNFVIDSLRVMGLNEHFYQLIWHCISSSSMNILWNGEVMGEFCPSRGICPGDPFSPHLFVICLERLSHLIQASVDDAIWKPITLSRCGPPITHLCFTDDLLIFAKASMEQVDVIKNCLDLFVASSGQKISRGKTRIYFFSKNVHHSRYLEIANDLGFSLMGDLGKYLGVLFQQREFLLDFLAMLLIN